MNTDGYQHYKRDDLRHARCIRQHSRNGYDKNDSPQRTHTRVASGAERPDNEAGAQWPHQIKESAGVAVIKISGEKCRNPEFWWWRRLPKDHLRARSFLEQT